MMVICVPRSSPLARVAYIANAPPPARIRSYPISSGRIVRPLARSSKNSRSRGEIRTTGRLRVGPARNERSSATSCLLVSSSVSIRALSRATSLSRSVASRVMGRSVGWVGVNSAHRPRLRRGFTASGCPGRVQLLATLPCLRCRSGPSPGPARLWW
jgi:hypothetical protein